MKTIKQIADELGVSKDKVKYRVKKLPSNWVKIENGITYITPEGERNIHIMLGKKIGKNLEKNYLHSIESTFNETFFSTNEQQKIKELEKKVVELEKQLEIERAHSAEAKLEIQKKYSDDILALTSRVIEDNNKLMTLIDQEQKLNAMNNQLPVQSERKLFSLFRRKPK